MVSVGRKVLGSFEPLDTFEKMLFKPAIEDTSGRLQLLQILVNLREVFFGGISEVAEVVGDLLHIIGNVFQILLRGGVLLDVFNYFEGSSGLLGDFIEQDIFFFGHYR